MTAPRPSTGAASAAKRRDSKLWSETFDVRLGATQPLSPKEIKRQEVRGWGVRVRVGVGVGMGVRVRVAVEVEVEVGVRVRVRAGLRVREGVR